MKALTAPFILPISKKPISDGALLVEDGKIVDVGERIPLLSRYPGAEVEDFPHSVLMPGLVNAHTHMDLLFFQGVGQETRKIPQFFDWLTEGWVHRKKQTLTDRRHCLEEGIRQLLRSGTTSVGDVGEYFGLVPQAANSPMRMVLFPELLTGGEASVQDSYEGVFSQVEEILAARSSRVTSGLAPYAAYTLSRHFLKIIAQQTTELRIPLKIHVAETFSEMQFFYESTGEVAEILFPKMGWKDQLPPAHRKTPIQYLDSIGFLENGPTLVGCNHLSDTDLETMARTGSKVVHSPRANSLLKLGHPPIKKLRTLKIPVAIGTDGTASLFSLSLWDELRYIQDHYPEAEQPNADELLRMATLEGAMALGLDKKVGSLDVGKEADIIALRVSKEVTLDQLPSWLVSHITTREVSAVFIEGKRIKLI